MFAASVARNPDGDAIRYFDGRITYRELDELTDAFAVALLDGGLQRGDRVAMYLQNVPQFIIGLVGTWKAGGIAVSINPMNRERELALLLTDSGAKVLVCLQGLYRDVAASVSATRTSRTVITTSELDFQTRDDPRAFPGSERATPDGTTDLLELIGRFRRAAAAVGRATGRTTSRSSPTRPAPPGPPKGAMNTHGNVVFNSQAYREWCGLSVERRDPRGGAAVPHHGADRAHHHGALPRRAAGAVPPVRAVAGHRRHQGAPADVHGRLDHGVHRADERAERRARRA